MGMDLDSILSRVKVEGKDSLGQHLTQRTDFVNDIVREITGTFRFPFLIRTDEITSTTTWVDLDKDVRNVLCVMVDDKRIDPISEEDYFYKRQSISNSNRAYYRLRWEKTKKLYQINFVNVDTGTTVELLVRDVWTDPGKLPSEFEEAVVCGALYKYLTFLEGDDLAVALEHKKRYIDLVSQNFNLLADDIRDDENDRILTNDEIEAYRAEYYEDEDE
jgi:hypothetical protein